MTETVITSYVAPIVAASAVPASTLIVTAHAHNTVVADLQAELDIAYGYIEKLFSAGDVWLFIGAAFVLGALTRFI